MTVLPMAGTGGSGSLRVPRDPGLPLETIDLRMRSDESGGVRLSMADGSPAPSHLTTKVSASWNAEALLVLFDASYRSLRLAPDSVPRDPLTGKTMELWTHSDVLEVFIGREVPATRCYREFQVAPDGRWIDIAIDHRTEPLVPDFEWRSGFTFRSEVDAAAGRWRVLFQLPWHALDAGDPTAGTWYCNFYRATGRFHGDELLAWSPPGIGPGCFHRYGHFGVLTLV